ncbi:MAG: bifunctional folylpolyglutamate synthase/dihydrofolate synthase [Blautia sp.]|nr:bifunctional folylpolyglutamate synthase/dihydrofolate synthase [Blautia sp.]MCM1202221.1 bifunctional folylpolyglutamate synthase/dihydrofolate synthase [Bacteroides fragilis]
MNYREAIEYVEGLRRYGCVPGLSSIRQLCMRLGNPQDKLRFVHIAGTNGKGSVLAYVSVILQEAGYKTGRYLSPALTDYRERFQINGKMIPKTQFCGYLERVREAASQMEAEGMPHPTQFEVDTALAFLYFLDKKCDIVVLEAGMGGLMDATNLVETTVCAVITSVSMDHMAALGSSLEEIARQKAGIIKEHCAVVTCGQRTEAMRVIEQESVRHGCELRIADVNRAKGVKYGLTKQRFTYGGYGSLEITMAGQYQIANAVLAVETVETLKAAGFSISEKALREGLLKTKWPGRFQIIGKKPTFVLDGAHNEDAALKLAQSVKFYFSEKKIIYVMGILADKEYDKIITIMAPYAEQIITVTPPHNPRALSGYELAQAVREHHPGVTVADSLQEAVEIACLLAEDGKDTVVLAFGSLSFLGELTNMIEHRDTFRRDSHGRSE